MSQEYNFNSGDRAWLNEAFEKLLVKLEAECLRVGSAIPYSTKNGKYHDLDVPGGISFWTNGFWPGILWQMYHVTQKELFLETASAVEKRLEENLENYEDLDHDIGFLYLPSSVANYKLTKDKRAYRNAMHVAGILAGRYNLRGGFIRAWNDKAESFFPGNLDMKGVMIVDCLMNIPLLFWASEESKDDRYRQIAQSHAETACRWIVREDGSCNHLVLFDSKTGGISGQSRWPRL